MEGNQSPQQLLKFLNSIGFGYNSERSMLEHCRDGKNLLKVIVQVIKPFEPAHLRSILLVQCHSIISELDRHRESLPFITDFLVARQVFRITKFDLRLSDIIHQGEGGREIAILSHLYHVWNWNKQVQGSNEISLGKLRLLHREEQKLRSQEAVLATQLITVQRQKQIQRQSLLEKTRQIAEVREKAAIMRNTKNQLATQKAQMQKEIIDLDNQIQQTSHRTKQLHFQVTQARKQLSINAPEILKQRMREQANYQKALAQQNQANNCFMRMRRVIEQKLEGLSGNLNKLHELNLQQLQSRNKSLKEHSRRYKLQQQQRRDRLRKIQQQINRLQNDIEKQEKRDDQQSKIIMDLKLMKIKLKEAVEEKKNEVIKIQKCVEELDMMYSRTLRQLQELDQKDTQRCMIYEQEMRSIGREIQEWNKKSYQALNRAHQIFQMGLFDRLI